MLVEFRLHNFRSYAAEKRFSMVAGTGKELPGNTMMVAGFDRSPLLRSAAIYGPNASGKSNLIHAFSFFRSFVLRSTENTPDGEKIPVVPFLLDPTLAAQPSEFEITFLMGGVRYQYGFIVSRGRVHEEWLTAFPKGKAQEWFHREVNASGKSSWTWSRAHLKGDKSQLAERTRENALFLSVAAQWNQEQIRRVYQWFQRQFKVLPRNVGVMNFTRNQLLNDDRFCAWLTRVLRAADTGIHRVIPKERKLSQDNIRFPGEMPADVKAFLTEQVLNDPRIDIRTTRLLRGTDVEIEWSLEEESDGTRRMFELLGPCRDVLERGAVMIMDELDTSLHAHVSREIVRLFNNPAANPHHAQLIFTTHDTSLLDLTLLRRDQVWFTSKDNTGATDLYSLADYSPRPGEAIQKGYLLGRYGATPMIGPLEIASEMSPEEGPETADSER